MVGKRAEFDSGVNGALSSDIDSEGLGRYRLPLKDLWEKRKTKAN
jgi:hypothetical protein